MLNSIRKFSSTIFAKILLFIIAIPFIFWGMGDVFRIGGKDTIAIIGNDKIYIQDFTRYVNNLELSKEITDEDLLDRLLGNFIGIKLISLESENLNINISDKSLSKIIKNEKTFKDKNKFSRIKYEKFLVTNSLSSVVFENNILEQEKKKQLFNFIGGGIKAPKFFVNSGYDLLNQKRSISLINLVEIYKKKFLFSDADIKNYHKNNIEKFTKIYKSVAYSKITPNELVGEEEFTSLFFQKLDEIEDAITSNISFDKIAEKYKLKVINSDFFSKEGKNIKNEKVVNFSKEVINDIFAFDVSESANFIDKEDYYILVGSIKNKEIINAVTDNKTRELILQYLQNSDAQKHNYALLKKINKGEFKENDFKNMAKTNKVKIKKITFNNFTDDKIISKELVKEIYKLPINKIGIFYDNIKSIYYLIQTNKVEKATIEENSENFKKYLIKSNAKIIKDIYATYDRYLNEKYKVEINYNTLNNVKNSF